MKSKIFSTNGVLLFKCKVEKGDSHRFSNAYALQEAIDAGVSMVDANLQGAYLQDIDIGCADFTGADFTGANLRNTNFTGSTLTDANFCGADLNGANFDICIGKPTSLMAAELGDTKRDFWDVLLRAPDEVSGLRKFLMKGKIDGKVYEGDCACLVGSLANIRGVDHNSLGNGLRPNPSRLAETWFFGIGIGDTPSDNIISYMTVEWLDEFQTLLKNANSSKKSRLRKEVA